MEERSKETSMDEKVQKEIDTLHQMLQNWKKCDLGYWTEEGPNDWIFDGFIEKTSMWLLPYVRRLRECGYITQEEYDQFIWRTRGECEDMRRLLGLPSPKESTS